MTATCRGGPPGLVRVPVCSATSRRTELMRWSAKLNPIQTRCQVSTICASTRDSFPAYACRYSVVASTIASGWLWRPWANSTGSSSSPNTSPVRQRSRSSSSVPGGNPGPNGVRADPVAGVDNPWVIVGGHHGLERATADQLLGRSPGPARLQVMADPEHCPQCRLILCNAQVAAEHLHH